MATWQGTHKTPRGGPRGRLVRGAVLFCLVAMMGADSTAGPGEPRTRSTTITGVVRDQHGEPIPRAFVRIEKPETTSVPNSWHDADAQGRFELENVPAGPVKIQAVAGHHARFSTLGKVFASRGGARGVVITLDAGRELRIKVEDYTKYDYIGLVTPPGAKLIWHQPGQTYPDWRWAPIAPDGSIRFVQLPDVPTFEVWGHASKDRPFKKSGLKPGKKVHVIQTVQGRTITGRFLPAQVGTVASPRVSASPYVQFVVARGRVRPDGTFILRGLPEGEFTLIAELGAKRFGGAVDAKKVKAGATDVEFDFSSYFE